MKKFKITVIDFLPQHKKFEVGKYADGTPACLGDVVEYKGEKNWFISYRYGEIFIKQIGMWAMIGMTAFKQNDFSAVEKTNTIGAGEDYLIIGYVTEPLYAELISKNVNDIQITPSS